MDQWAPFWQPFATPALVTMLHFTPISTQIVPKCAGEVLNKAREALPGFSGFSTPVLHLCSWKTDVHPRDLDLDWESKTLLKAWCYNFGLAQRSQCSSWGWKQHSQSREQRVRDKPRCSTHQHKALYPDYSRQRALCLCHWSSAMKWESLSLPLDLKQCRCISRLSGLRCANLSFFSLQSCTFWCLSGQPLSLQIYCRSKKSY